MRYHYGFMIFVVIFSCFQCYGMERGVQEAEDRQIARDLAEMEEGRARIGANRDVSQHVKRAQLRRLGFSEELVGTMENHLRTMNDEEYGAFVARGKKRGMSIQPKKSSGGGVLGWLWGGSTEESDDQRYARKTYLLLELLYVELHKNHITLQAQHSEAQEGLLTMARKIQWRKKLEGVGGAALALIAGGASIGLTKLIESLFGG